MENGFRDRLAVREQTRAQMRRAAPYLTFVDDDEDAHGEMLTPLRRAWLSQCRKLSRLTLHAVQASSTDHQLQNLGNTLTNNLEFWSSAGSAYAHCEEALLYRLADVATVQYVALQVYRANYQHGDPLYPPGHLTVYLGPSPTQLRPVTPQLRVAPTDNVQVFAVPTSAPPAAYMLLVLHGKGQRQWADLQHYVAIQHVAAFGQPLGPGGPTAVGYAVRGKALAWAGAHQVEPHMVVPPSYCRDPQGGITSAVAAAAAAAQVAAAGIDVEAARLWRQEGGDDGDGGGAAPEDDAGGGRRVAGVEAAEARSHQRDGLPVRPHPLHAQQQQEEQQLLQQHEQQHQQQLLLLQQLQQQEQQQQRLLWLLGARLQPGGGGLGGLLAGIMRPAAAQQQQPPVVGPEAPGRVQAGRRDPARASSLREAVALARDVQRARTFASSSRSARGGGGVCACCLQECGCSAGAPSSHDRGPRDVFLTYRFDGESAVVPPTTGTASTSQQAGRGRSAAASTSKGPGRVSALWHKLVRSVRGRPTADARSVAMDDMLQLVAEDPGLVTQESQMFAQAYEASMDQQPGSLDDDDDMPQDGAVEDSQYETSEACRSRRSRKSSSRRAADHMYIPGASLFDVDGITMRDELQLPATLFVPCRGGTGTGGTGGVPSGDSGGVAAGGASCGWQRSETARGASRILCSGPSHDWLVCEFDVLQGGEGVAACS